MVRMAPNYEPRAKFRTWLFTMARNLCIDESRRAEKGRVDSLDEPIGDSGNLRRIDLFADTSQLPADQGPVRAEFNARLATALAEMPAEQREVFELRVVAELRFPEIASILSAVAAVSVWTRCVSMARRGTAASSPDSILCCMLACISPAMSSNCRTLG